MTRTIQIKAPDDGRVIYTLEFTETRNSRDLYGYTNAMPNLFLIRGAIKCIFKDTADAYLGIGESYCYRKDKWDAKKGERIALGKALATHNHKLQKPARAMIWQQYLAARPLVQPESERDKRKRLARVRMEQSRQAKQVRLRLERVERKRKIERVMAGLEKLGQTEPALIGYDTSKGE